MDAIEAVGKAIALRDKPNGFIKFIKARYHLWKFRYAIMEYTRGNKITKEGILSLGFLDKYLKVNNLSGCDELFSINYIPIDVDHGVAPITLLRINAGNIKISIRVSDREDAVISVVILINANDYSDKRKAISISKEYHNDYIPDDDVVMYGVKGEDEIPIFMEEYNKILLDAFELYAQTASLKAMRWIFHERE